MIDRFKNYFESKWQTFAYNYGWSDYVLVFDGWIAKCAMTVPVIGYLILFNDTVAQHLSFRNLASENTSAIGISSIARLKFIYFGLIFLGSANILYRLRRPFVFKIGTDQFKYVERAFQHFTVSAYIDIHGVIRHEGHHTLHGKYYDSDYDSFLDLALGKRDSEDRQRRRGATSDWSSAKSKYEGLLRSMLIENFFRSNVKNRMALTFCIALSVTGYLLLLVPSVDLFVKVVAVSFSR